ncbi:unnamed protein product [Prunus armeniaca]
MGEWERGAWPGGSGQCVCRIWAAWGSNRETAAAWENGREGHGLVDLGSAYVGFGRRGDQIERRRRHGRMGERGMAWWIWAMRMSDLGGVGRSNKETAAAWENGREGHGLVDLGSAYVGFGRRGDQIERRRRHGRMGERGMAWWIWAVRMSDLGGVGIK